MAYDANIAEKQNEIRREVKRKQRVGAGKGKAKRIASQVENVKLDRHVTGKFSEAVQDAIKKHFMDNPEVPITSEFFRPMLKNGSLEVEVADPYGTVRITETDIECGLQVWSVTVFTAGGYGIKFKTIGGRDGKPRRVIIL